jgi:hypothetical protein
MLRIPNGPLIAHRQKNRYQGSLDTHSVNATLRCSTLRLALLGQSSPEFTRQIYLHVMPAEQRRAVKDVEKFLVGLKSSQIEEVAGQANR